MKKMILALTVILVLTACAPTTVAPAKTAAISTRTPTNTPWAIPTITQTSTPEPPTQTLTPSTVTPTKPVTLVQGTYKVGYPRNDYKTGDDYLGTIVLLKHYETYYPTIFLLYPGYHLHIRHSGPMSYAQDNYSLDSTVNINRVALFADHMYEGAIFKIFIGPANLTPIGWTNFNSIPYDKNIWWEIIENDPKITPKP